MKCSLLSWMAVSSVCWWGLTNEIQQQRLSLLCSMDSDGESHRAHGSLQVSPLPSTLTGCSHVSSSWGTSPGSWPALGCYLGDEIELPHPRTHHSSWEHLSVARVHSFLPLVMFSLSSLKAPASVLFFFHFCGGRWWRQPLLTGFVPVQLPLCCVPWRLFSFLSKYQPLWY